MTDCVAANLLACETESCQGEICNVGSGVRVTIADLHALIRRIVGAGSPPQYDAPRVGDVKHSLAGISRAKSFLGYEPGVSLETGLAQTVEWVRTAEVMATPA